MTLDEERRLQRSMDYTNDTTVEFMRQQLSKKGAVVQMNLSQAVKITEK